MQTMKKLFVYEKLFASGAICSASSLHLQTASAQSSVQLWGIVIWPIAIPITKVPVKIACRR